MMKDLEALLVDCRKEAETVQKEKERSPRRKRSSSRSPHRSGRDDRHRRSPHRFRRGSRLIFQFNAYNFLNFWPYLN